MNWRAISGVLVLAVVSCSPVEGESVGTSSATTILAHTTTTAPAALVTTTAVAPHVPFDWPEPTGPPEWTSTSMDLPGTTHVQLAHGPLGFLSWNFVSRGAVIRISQDGVAWTETAILTGPNGEEQVSPRDMVVTKDEFIIAGETWTNTVPGPEQIIDGIWRSTDGRTWTFHDSNEIESGSAVTAIAQIEGALLLVGAVRGEDGSNARPRIWIQHEDGAIEIVSDSIAGFDEAGYVEGVYANGDRVAVWGDGARQYIWTTLDGESWIRAEIGTERPSRVNAAVWFGDKWVVTSSSGVWVSEDGKDWTLTAGNEVFATDPLDSGGASFRTLHTQDGYLVAQAGMSFKGHPAWCYLDLSTCRQWRSTILVSPNGYDWRQIPVPGQDDLPGHPVEIHSMLVNGKLTVIHTLGDDATISVLDSVANAKPINSGSVPALPFEVVVNGDTIEVGIEYGYGLNTHCPFYPIGPLNGMIWSIDSDSLSETSISELRRVDGYGFIRLTENDEIEYIVDGAVVGIFRPDPDRDSAGFCY